MSGVDLGFPEEREAAWLTNRYFPSKIGGKPAWLDLESLPSKEQLLCPSCNHPKAFLCQIYAPYDVDCTFHRTIFVFICRTSSCQVPNSSATLSVLRSQLPRKNKFYSAVPPSEEGDPLQEIPAKRKLCVACGCLGPLSCGRCKNVNYCSAHHQRAHWPQHKKSCQTKDSCIEPVSTVVLPEILLPEYEIVIESTDAEEGNISTAERADGETAEELRLKDFEQLAAAGKTGTMKDVPESELEKYIDSSSNDDDKYFHTFKQEVSKDPEQIVRYKRGGNPLWITDVECTISSQLQIPHCENCGSKRQYEFQLMPQLLILLKNEHLDWGVIAVYTCSKSCQPPVESGYLLEYVIKQDLVLNDKPLIS